MLGKYQKLLPYRRVRANAWTRSIFGENPIMQIFQIGLMTTAGFFLYIVIL